MANTTTVIILSDLFNQVIHHDTANNLQLDLRSEIIETLWERWNNSFSEDYVYQRCEIRQIASDFSKYLTN